MGKTCGLREDCPFFIGRLRKAPHLVKFLKEVYCLADVKSCARYRVSESLGTGCVPPGMWPNEVEEAIRVISSVQQDRDKGGRGASG